MVSHSEIRQLRQADTPALLSLSTLAGWNQTAADWTLLLRLHPEGCLGIERDSRIVASTTLICYGRELAWVGMVLTHPDYRGNGFATRLLAAALDLASAKGIATLKLDATDQGAPLYEKLGFRTEQPIERWSGRTTGKLSSVPSQNTPDLQLDREAFGAYRSPLLAALSAHSTIHVHTDGFAMTRPGARATYLGPCVARTPEAATLLIGETLQANEGDWFWDLLPSNRRAVELAKNSGFQPVRKLVRMARGNNMESKDEMIYAAAGFELG